MQLKRRHKVLAVLSPVVLGIACGSPLLNEYLPPQVAGPTSAFYNELANISDDVSATRLKMFIYSSYAERNARYVAKQGSSAEELKKAKDEAIQTIQNKAGSAMTTMPRG